MKVLHVDTGRDWRGGQSQVLMLARGLARRGCETQIVAAKSSPLAARARQAELGVRELPLRFEADLGSARLLRKMTSGDRVIVHAHTPHALGIALLARGLAKKPAIFFTRRVVFPIKKWAINRWKLNQADVLIAVSQAVATELERAGIDRSQIHVIHSGFDPDEFPYQGLHETRPYSIAILGSIEKEKGIVDALQLVRRNFQHPVEFHFFGTGAAARDLQKEAKQNSRIHVHGFVSDVSSLLGRMFAALSFSRSEGFPNLLLQAMATGLPVIAIDNAAVAEMIPSDQFGFRVQSHSQAATKLEWLIAHPEEARDLGRKSSEYVRSRFTADKMVQQTLDLYGHFLQGLGK